MLTYLFRSATAWTAIGLVGGLVYREVTKLYDYTGFTQLALVHTHSLALGTTVMLVLLALTAALPGLSADRRMRWGTHLLNAGLVLTVGMLSVKGTLQVREVSWADHAALAGVSGLGHMTLTAAFVFLLLAIGRAVKPSPTSAGAGSTEGWRSPGGTKTPVLPTVEV